MWRWIARPNGPAAVASSVAGLEKHLPAEQGIRRVGEHLGAGADRRAPAQVMVAGRELAYGLAGFAVRQPGVAQPASRRGIHRIERHDSMMRPFRKSPRRSDRCSRWHICHVHPDSPASNA
jgi:hypothetical protein